ncbi:hypothetical protein K3G63_03740 [Hymenobacter sp. HSC-4F20]|uniref:hypothetical protein n=1 Tax=Hymenobacter sp. HSC-4F20 TaxID=2864135 RepID=UPI001C73310B|nr:hypothetical protein [Hymenobacter sp. HSC-4F20]MBX0289533.1 hypothetical protein [Hymenobacter sp. HSC-4F20]
MVNIALPKSISLDTIIAGFAAIVSFIALYLSHRSNVFSKKAFLLAKEEYGNKTPYFSIYLVNSFRLIDKNRNTKAIAFNITINNKSETSNSFKPILEIEYIRDDNSVFKANYEHNPKLYDLINKNKLNSGVFEDHINLSERTVESKWLLFEESDVFVNYRADIYTIKIHDLNGNEKQISSSLLKNLEQ